MKESTRRERMLMAQKIEIRPGSEARRRKANIPLSRELFDRSKHAESLRRGDGLTETPRVRHRIQPKE